MINWTINIQLKEIKRTPEGPKTALGAFP